MNYDDSFVMKKSTNSSVFDKDSRQQSVDNINANHSKTESKSSKNLKPKPGIHHARKTSSVRRK